MLSLVLLYLFTQVVNGILKRAQVKLLVLLLEDGPFFAVSVSQLIHI